MKEQHASMTMTGDKNGKLKHIMMETRYQEADIRLQAFAQIYIVNYGDEITYGTKTTEDVLR